MGVNTMSWKDTDVIEGVKYVYTVRAVDSSGNSISGYNSAGVTVTAK